MTPRIRFAAAFALGAALCLASGCATGGSKDVPSPSTPVADKEWHSLV